MAVTLGWDVGGMCIAIFGWHAGAEVDRCRMNCLELAERSVLLDFYPFRLWSCEPYVEVLSTCYVLQELPTQGVPLTLVE